MPGALGLFQKRINCPAADHTGYRKAEPMAKARNRRVQVVDLLRSNGIRLPPVHDKDKAFDSGRMLAHSSASKPTGGYETQKESKMDFRMKTVIKLEN